LKCSQDISLRYPKSRSKRNKRRNKGDSDASNE
jgi:hypothetical protein